MQNPDSCHRYELTFDPPIEVESTMGNVDPFYPDVDFTDDGITNKVEKTANVINKNGLLHITEVVNTGEIISIELQPGLRLDKMRKGDEQELQIYTTNKNLMYYITSGKRGAVDLSAMVIKDVDGFFHELESDLTDNAMRAYIVRHTLIESSQDLKYPKKLADILNHDQAAKYLNLSPKTLYNIKEITRLKHNKYRKIDLDNYMDGKSGKKHRR